ncbi:hypothetical protein FO519_008931 [Halicephalobus sp. NKZ332]|nr:hypothetical protein FO519_008931 [Halicephalobus sp. NKZ332]
MCPLENRNNVHTNRQDVRNVDNGNDEPPRKRLRSQSHGPDSCQLVSEMLIKDSRDGCYWKFIRTNNQMVCTYCKKVTVRYTPEGFIEIVGNHLSECKPFNPNDEEVSEEKVRIESFRIGNYEYKRHTKGSVDTFLCSECLQNGRLVEAEISCHVTRTDPHCKACRNKQEDKQTKTRSMSRAPSVLCVPEREVPTDRYRLEENKDRSKYAAVLVLEDNNPSQAKEFHYRYPTNNGDSTVFCCPYCYKNFLKYNKNEGKLYWLRDEENHGEGFKCLAYPVEVLMEKYDRPRRNCPSSNGWWKKMSKEHGFPMVKRYHSTLKDMRNEN